MESKSKHGESVVDPNSTVGGGVEDVYGEDRATEDQLVTPWTVTVARYIHIKYRLLVVVIIRFLHIA